MVHLYAIIPPLLNCDERKVSKFIVNYDALIESSHVAYLGWWVGGLLAERYWKQ